MQSWCRSVSLSAPSLLSYSPEVLPSLQSCPIILGTKLCLFFHLPLRIFFFFSARSILSFIVFSSSYLLHFTNPSVSIKSMDFTPKCVRLSFSLLRDVDSVSEWTLAGGQTANACAVVCLDSNVTKCEAVSSNLVFPTSWQRLPGIISCGLNGQYS